MRHRVDLYEPTDRLGEDGQREGADVVKVRNIPCSITPLVGREAEVARQLVATATLRVEMWGPLPINSASYLVERPSGKRLNIGHVSDKDRNGLELTLLCGEVV
jgi:head-tail adaptor